MLNHSNKLELKFNLHHIRQLYQTTNPQSWGDLAATAKALPNQLNDFSLETAVQLVLAFEHLQLAGELFTDNPEQAFEILKQHAKHNFQPTLNMPAAMPEFTGVLGGEVKKFTEPVPSEEIELEIKTEQSKSRSWLSKIFDSF